MRALAVALGGIFVLIACGGAVYDPKPQCGAEETYCHWGVKETCCPVSYPFCGADGTNCPAGKCCSAEPK